MDKPNGLLAEELYDKALKKWGIESQVNMLIEEMAELIIGISKFRRNGSNQFLEEIADVEIMIEQIKRFLGKETNKIIELHKKDKLNRLKDRLDTKEI